MNWAVKLSITERVVTVAERVPRCFAGTPRSFCSGSTPSAVAPPAPVPAAAGTRPEQRRRCAVVIDRDPEVVSGLSALLMPQLDVQSAVSPLSAALLLDQLEHVDLAFVELELPDLAGEQLLQQLGRWPDAIRVLLTQKPLAESALPRNAYLAHLVLNKPISAQVVGALQRATLGLLRV